MPVVGREPLSPNCLDLKMGLYVSPSFACGLSNFRSCPSSSKVWLHACDFRMNHCKIFSLKLRKTSARVPRFLSAVDFLSRKNQRIKKINSFVVPDAPRENALHCVLFGNCTPEQKIHLTWSNKSNFIVFTLFSSVAARENKFALCCSSSAWINFALHSDFWFSASVAIWLLQGWSLANCFLLFQSFLLQDLRSKKQAMPVQIAFRKHC